MPELPEIYNLAHQMDKELKGRVITAVEVRQEKCLNLPAKDFVAAVLGKSFGDIKSKGKWIFAELRPQTYFLLNLGMGGEVLYHGQQDTIPSKYRLKFDLGGQSCLTINFWWFGYAHLARDCELEKHKMTASLGLAPLNEEEYTYENFARLLEKKRGNIKALLMDQKNVAGIGNVYIQDILFRAKLHPARKIEDIEEGERHRLFLVIRENLGEAAELGGIPYERDLYNQPGRFSRFLVGYKPGQPCPECGTLIGQIRVAGTKSFFCPNCQK